MTVLLILASIVILTILALVIKLDEDKAKTLALTTNAILFIIALVGFVSILIGGNKSFFSISTFELLLTFAIPVSLSLILLITAVLLIKLAIISKISKRK
jgi:hypothetical protein